MLRSTFIFLLTVVGVRLQFDDLVTQLKLDSSVAVTVLSSNDSCTKAGWSCSGCQSTRLCKRFGPDSFEEMRTMHCVEPNQYCQPLTGTCGREPSEALCGEVDDFICLKANGYFPDPKDKQVYHVCVNYNSIKYRCLNEYNPINESCTSREDYDWKRRVQGFSPCYHYMEGRYVANMDNPRYFGICLDGSVEYVDRCPPGYRLWEFSQQCQADCFTLNWSQYPADYYYRKTSNNSYGEIETVAREYNLTNVLDCRTYFNCRFRSEYDKPEPIMYNCPPQEGFSLKDGKCISSWSDTECQDN